MDPVAGALLWAAHDDHVEGPLGPLRWSYLVSINSNSAIDVSAGDLQGVGPTGAVVVWPVSVGGSPVSNVTRLEVGQQYVMRSFH